MHARVCITMLVYCNLTAVLNRKAMTDVTSYRHPPRSVHAVVQATLLLFGEDEDLTLVREWWEFKGHHLQKAQP